MAREEHDREDLMREATAFVDRAEFDVAGFALPVFVGFRKNDAASIYFGSERVYHFNSDGQLRRAHRDGLLYKADRGNLVSLDRRREAQQTSLVARLLAAEEARAFLSEMRAALARFAAAFAAQQVASRGEVTGSSTSASGETAVRRIEKWLAELPTNFEIARSPRAY